MKRASKILIFLVPILALAYAFGPKPDFDAVNPQKSEFSVELDQIESYISNRDQKVSDLKPQNEGKLYWFDSESKSKTEYAVLYLHGFSASGMEGAAVHLPFAKAIGANLYVPRLVDSGRKTIDTFKGMTPKALLESAKEAIAVAKELGEKLIVVSCSTGGTYSAYLAGYDSEIEALIMLSPNIDVFDKRSELILKPWGVKLLTAMQGGDYREITHYNDEKRKYWNWKYHNDGVIALKSLIDQTMKEVNFKKISQPTFIMSYYKNEEEQDHVVSVERMKDFYNQISTVEDQKRYIECPRCESHVISSKLFNSNTDLVFDEIMKFSREVLKIQPLAEAELAH